MRRLRKLLHLLLALAMVLTMVPAGIITAHAGETDGTMSSNAIVEQPQDVTVYVGETARFTVEADGDDLTYQWQHRAPGGAWKNSTASGYNTAAMSVSITKVTWNGFQFRCVITDADGQQVITDAATLTVLTSITGQPQNINTAVGTTAVFSVSATDVVKYQWQHRAPGGSWKNSTATGYDTAAMSVTVTKPAWNGFQFRCVVTDANGRQEVSNVATLTVQTSITGQPRNISTIVGTTARFTVTAVGPGLQYQWQHKAPNGAWKNSTATGYNTAAMSVTVTKLAWNGFQFRCVITDANGVKTISDVATLTVGVIAITAQPQDINTAVGTTATFTVTALGTGLTYQWQHKAPNGAWKNSTASGYNTAAMSVTVTKGTWNGFQFRCVVTDANGNKVTSDVATLTVRTVITAQPEDLTIPVGSPAVFTVTATGAGLTYQWQHKAPSGAWKNSTAKGYNTAAMTVNISKVTWNGFQFRCVITDANGVETVSDVSTLTALEAMDTGTCGDHLTWSWYAGGLLVIRGTGPMWDYLNMQDRWAPWHSKWVREVRVESGVTSIGNCAFYHQSVQTVILADTVTSIGDEAFYGCDMTSIQLPAKLKTIGAGAFCDCDKLTTVTLPDSVTTLGGSAFASCDALTSVTLSAGLTKLPGAVFKSSPITSVVIPDGVTSVGSYAFAFCDKLRKVTFGSGVQTIGEYAFYECPRLTGLTVPDSVVSIDKYAFDSCTNLTTVKLGNGLKTIGDYAFYGAGIDKITFGTGLQTIGSYAFRDCLGMEVTLNLPSGLKSIGDGAFQGLELLKAVSIPDSVTGIGAGAFGGCVNMTSIRLPAGLKRIEKELLCGCENLKSVTIPESVEYIGDAAFYGCDAITSLTVPKNVKDICYHAMADCENLTSVKFMGPAPEFLAKDFLFSGMSTPHTIKVYYPSRYSSWSSLDKTGFGALVQWIAY